VLPTLVIVGRPNVGKSTLFNRLTRSRAALVADFPGLTRDRHYGRARSGEQPFLVVDTGGFEPVAKDGILYEMAKQTRQAIAEADVVVFLVDARQGLTDQDRNIADLLRRSGRPIVLAANKAEGLLPERAASEFYELGLGEPYPISSAHGDNVADVAELALSLVPAAVAAGSPATHAAADAGAVKVAIIGRPNSGKSSLIVDILYRRLAQVFYNSKDKPGKDRKSVV
jgi:GTP-binding protein